MPLRAYLRLDPEYSKRKAGYPVGAALALIDVLCEAEAQPHRGRFRSEKLLRLLVGRSARWVGYLLEHGDLVKQRDGSLYVDGWDEWQEGDWKVAERVKRIRSRRENEQLELLPGGVTDDSSPTVTRRTVAVDAPTRAARARARSGGGGGGISGGRSGRPLRVAQGNGRVQEPDDERATAIARARAKLEDPTASESVKQAARFALDRMGVTP
jgi:hypothetical protein